MQIAEQNALRATARRALKEIQQAWQEEKADTVGQRDKISRRILLSYEKQIYPRFTFYQLLHAIGVIRGVLKER